MPQERRPVGAEALLLQLRVERLLPRRHHFVATRPNGLKFGLNTPHHRQRRLLLRPPEVESGFRAKAKAAHVRGS